MRNSYRLALSGLVLLLAACGSGETDNGNDVAAAAANDAASATRPPAPVPAKPAVVLEGDGLQLGGRRLAFGATQDAVVKDLAAAIGKPATEEGNQEECGGGPLYSVGWDGKFYALFEEGKFAGWEDRGRFQTQTGLRVGSPRQQVASLTGVSIEESTLGIEFSAGGFGGVLESKAPDAKVTDFWAGTTCVFR
ncbi:MAG TPA: hypothetical protein VHM92_06720 [Allosphingosinicella sp.]|nr:hypothetical protein [Allosphingosinicella sp.]